jgi:hypothetical protein
MHIFWFFDTLEVYTYHPTCILKFSSFHRLFLLRSQTLFGYASMVYATASTNMLIHVRGHIMFVAGSLAVILCNATMLIGANVGVKNLQLDRHHVVVTSFGNPMLFV